MSSLSARETAYQTIRSRIITMELKPGDPLNDRELAEELGISRQHLASIEAPNMDRGISLELLFNIATVLEVEPYQLLKFRPEE